jgi:hypothetical protein
MEDNNKIIQPKPNRKCTLRLTQEFNEKFTQIRKSLLISNFSIMKDDITNYRPFSEQQLIQVETLTETEKIELIKLYNTMFSTLENIVN